MASGIASTMGQTDLQALVDMGFPENRAQKALARTKHRGMQVALDWLVEHQDDVDIDEPMKEDTGHRLTDEGTAAGGASGEDAPVEVGAKSYRCEDCGKVLRDAAAIQLHAARTQHENFAESTEEIKPLTEEEKKEQLEKLKAKLAAKREERQRAEQEEQLKKETDRRKQGRVGQEVQQKFQEQAQLKLVEEEKRKRAEENAYKAKLKQQLEQDKLERLARKQQAQGGAAAAVQAPAPVAAAPAAAPTASTANYTECRVQVRLPNNAGTFNGTFGADDPLSAVIDRVQLEKGLPSVTLVTTFNRKTYTAEDYGKSLRELGLLPSVAFICK